MKIFSHKKRAVHLGAFPMEELARQDNIPDYSSSKPQSTLGIEDESNPHSLANAMPAYINLFDRMRFGEAGTQKVPLPDDLQERSNHLKAACYFLDASIVGIC